MITSNFVSDFGGDNDSVRASATAFLDSGSVAVVDGAGLLRVPFHVAAGVTGEFGVHLDLDAFAGTVLSDEAGGSVAFTPVDGAIAVSPAVAVPSLQPGGMVGLALSLTLVGCVALGRD